MGIFRGWFVLHLLQKVLVSTHWELKLNEQEYLVLKRIYDPPLILTPGKIYTASCYSWEDSLVFCHLFLGMRSTLRSLYHAPVLFLAGKHISSSIFLDYVLILFSPSTDRFFDSQQVTWLE